MGKNRVAELTARDEEQVSGNGGELAIGMSRPKRVELEIEGVSDLIFHAYNHADVEGKKGAKKGDAVKKTDNVEAYVYRDKDGYICIPSLYLRGALVNAAKNKQDPRSSRKSACDLFKAAVIPENELVRILVDNKPVKEWDMLDTRPVQVNHARVPRTRPKFAAGWKARFTFMITAPTLLTPDLLHEVANDAGLLVGIADFRPLFGRFQVNSFKVLP